jgi:hypothetical protein
MALLSVSLRLVDVDSSAVRGDPELIASVFNNSSPTTGVVAGNALDSALVGRARRLSGVGGGRPAAEELECLFGARAGLGGVDEDR